MHVRAAHEPIAIIGMACRLPGPAVDLESYWDLLRNGASAITEVPADRWNVDALYDPDPATPRRMYARHGGFVRNLDQFDPAFFEISPREAQTLDPQQRLLLEVAWEALEHAGLSASGLRGSDTGVFVGIVGGTEYSDRLKQNRAIDADLYAGTGSAPSIAAGRVAYCFGFHGPALAVDTACSSSLLSVHLAMQSLRRGECRLALAGGVNAILSPLTTMVLCRGRMLSARGQCATFDAAADGYVRGEGCGMVVLKTLAHALEDGDRILGVLRGSAVNQDGRSSGLTAPNGVAQEALLRAALADADVSPDDVSYIEAHGTGTRLGDPIEIRALQAVFGQRAASDPLRVGSVKTNIGHLEAAAGVAALIKVLASLEHELIPAHLNFRTPNPAVDWSAAPVEVAVEAMPWAHGARWRLAGVSAFAFSGTNVHLLVEEPPLPEPRSTSTRPGHLVTLSARTESALRSQAERLDAWLDAHPLPLEDVAYTMNAGRARLEHRAAFVATSIADARKRLTALARDGAAAAGTETGMIGNERPRVAFLYTGQGSQMPGMGRELFHSQPVFRAAIDECDAVFDPIEGARVCDWLYGDIADRGSDIQRIGLAQPALFAIEYAVTQLWRSWGIQPEAVAGHSIGEITAACVAGALSLKDAASLVAGGGRLLPSLPANGGMRAVRGNMAQVSSLLADGDLSVWISNLNAPDEVVVAGLQDDIVRFDERCRAAGLATSPLNAVHAFHTPLMTPMVDQLRATADAMTPRPPSVSLISTLTGRALPAGALMDTDYWYRQMLSPVAFSGAIQELARAGYDTFVEIGPQPLLTLLGRRSVPSKACVWLGSLRRGRSDWLQMQGTLAALFARGVDFDARALAAPDHPRRVALPGYPFERRRWWIDAYQDPESQDMSGSPDMSSTTVVRSALSGERLRQQIVDPSRDVVASGQRAFDIPVYPAAGFLAQIVATTEGRSDAAIEIRGFTVHQPLVFSNPAPRVLQTVLQDADARMSGVVFSAAGGADVDCLEWIRHVSADVALVEDVSAHETVVTASGEPTPDEVAGLYDGLASQGLIHGASHQLVEAIRSEAGQSVARLRAPAIADRDIRLALRVDSALQVLSGALQTVVDGRTDTVWLPVSIARLSIDPRAATVPCRAVARSRMDAASDASETTTGDVWCFDDNGRLIMALEGCTFRRTSAEVLRRLAPDETETWLHAIAWRPAPDTPSERVHRDWLVVGNPRGVGAALAERLDAAAAAARSVEHARVIDALDVAALAAHAGHGGRRGLLDLRGLDVGTGTPDETAETAVDHLLAIAQEIARQPAGAALELVVVTRGATGSMDSPAGLDGAAIAGFSRVLAQEHPDLSVRTVDVAADANDDAMVAALADELTHVTHEPEVAIRGAKRWVPRLTRGSRRPASTGPNELRAPTTGRRGVEREAPRPDGSYLITGGLGGVGLTLADDLAARGARHLILMSRSAPSPHAAGVIAQLENAGVSVRVEAADVTNAGDVERVLSAIPADRPLCGVVHAAGVLDDGLVRQMTPERVNRVFAPKVRGAWVLHTLTRSIPLDFFVLCSSVSAVFGSPGQSNYAAANAWMDALARMRVAQGLPALSVNWGAWREVGMAARLSDGQRDRWAAQGFALIPPAMAGNALWRALRARSAQAIVQPVDWAMFGRALGHRPIPPLLSELVHETVDRARSDKASPDEARLRLADTPAGERADRLRAHIRTQIAQVLGLDSDAAVGDDQPLTELGIDSLMAVELSNRLNASLGTALAPTFAFEFPTVSGITTHLLDAMAGSDTASHSPSSVDAIVDEVSSLDAEAVDDLLGRLEDSGTASTR